MSPRTILATALFAALLALPAPAHADFGFLPGEEGFAVSATGPGGAPEQRAGAHPDPFELKIGLRKDGALPDGDLRDAHLRLPPGFLLNPTAVPECTALRFSTPRSSPFETSLSGEDCPDDTQLGTVAVDSAHGPTRHFGIFNLASPYGRPGAIGFAPFGVPVVLSYRVREEDAGLTVELENLPQTLGVSGLDLRFWGTPWALEHDGERGDCLNEADPAAHRGELSSPAGPENKPPFHPGTCTIANPDVLDDIAKSGLVLPTTPCGAPLPFALTAVSWRGEVAEAAAELPALGECRAHRTVPDLRLTSDRTAVGTGLVFELAVNDGGGILNPNGIARPAIKKAVVALPDGLTINPSVGAGLGVCSEAEFARETISSAPGAGCPNASKVGTVEVRGMLGIEEPLRGSLFVAKPYENRFGSLLALYMTVANQRRGLFVKSVGKVEPDERNGRLLTTFDELPRLLYTQFRATLREGNRAMMISPPTCGDYPVGVDLSSWAEPNVFSHDAVSFFRVSRGLGGGECPRGVAPFAPKLVAGSLNPIAAASTAFSLHMTREDSDREITSYSATFPPGLLANLNGTSYCPEAAIEAAKHRSSALEEASPSCPASSYIGSTLAGYGVGSVLAYAPGALYLAGPYHGAPFSTVAITAARVGPFDLETVVIRSAIRIDPRTAQASIDAAGSDRIPHILKGIPLHLRDVRVLVDRPRFVVNPTSCDRLTAASKLTGADLFAAAPEVSAVATDRFQLLDCQALGFAPRMRLQLKGGTTRGKYPSLRAIVTPRPGQANIARATVTMPPSEFLAQEHIKTICGRGQSAAGRCPADSIYGRARAISPLLDEPLEGPVYLRASDNPLPDLVAELRGKDGLRIDVVGRIGSHKGGMRATYDVLPDAAVTRFTLTLFGGKRGLLANSDNACKAPAATARLVGHDNKGAILRPKLVNPACKAKPKKRRHEKRSGR